MSWSANQSAINAATHAAFSEPGVIRCPGWAADAPVTAIVNRLPLPIGNSGAYEEGPTATVIRSDLPGDLESGSDLILDTGERFAIEAWSLTNGVYNLTLRPEAA